jgi:hypothetical protein
LFFVYNCMMSVALRLLLLLLLLLREASSPLPLTQLKLTMEASDIRSLVQVLQSTDLDLDDAFLQLMKKTCACLEMITAERCRSIVRMAGSRACLQVFQSDGWSTDSRSRIHSQSVGVDVARVGRLRTEFVVQRTLVKAAVGGEMHLGIKLERPRPLTTKKCVDIWSAACDHACMLKLQGHTGISLTMYVQDGLFAKPFAARMKARHTLFFTPDMCPLVFASPIDRELAEMKDWVFSTRCVAHSCSTALKWGMKKLVTSETLLEDVHITISALLRGSTGLLKSIPKFLTTFAVFDRPDPADEDALERMWGSLDVAARDLHLFVLVDPLWYGGKLHVRRSLLDRPDCIGCMTTVVTYCLSFVDFSDTRWVKVGTCGRRYARALMIGVDQLVQIAEADDGVAKWHLAGYNKKSSAAVRLYLCVAAFGSRPSEGLLVELMEDDRLLLHADVYWNVLFDEMRYLTSIAPPLLYTTVSGLLSTDAFCFKSHVLEVGLASIGYLYLDVWKPLAAAPLKFALGDIRRNVEELKLAGAQLEGTSGKIQSLCVMGYEEDCVEALVLLREAGCTSILVEQAHASGAQLMRRHPQLGYGNLHDRMTVHNGRTLFHECKWDKEQARISQRLEEVELQMKGTTRITGRHAFVQMLVQECKKVRAHGGPSEHAVRRSVMKMHGPQYAALRPDQQECLRIRAGAIKRQKLDELSECKEHLLGQLELLRQRRKDSEQFGLVNHMDSVRFSEADFVRFSQLWEELGRSTFGGLLDPPRPVPAAIETLIQAEIRKATPAATQNPEWLSAVVAHRDAYEGTGFFSLTTSPSADKIYKFLLAMASPYKAVFLECVRCSLTRCAFVRYGEYTYKALRIVSQSDVPWTDKSDMMVYPEVLVAGDLVRTLGEPVAFSVYSRFHRAVAAPRQSSSDTRSRKPSDPEVLRLLQLEYPWMSLDELEALLSKTRYGSGTAASAPSASSGASSSSGPASLPEDAVAAVASELEALKEQAGHGLGDLHFKVRVLGGDWSVARVKSDASNVGSYPADKSTALWCQAVGWPPTPGQKTFACRKFGTDAAQRLAGELNRRANHFCGGWIADGSPSGYSFDELHAAYRSPLEYNDWIDTLPIASDAWKAAEVMRDLKPLPVPGD